MLKVSDKLYRGKRPASYKELAEKGIKNVICLQSGFYTELHDDNLEYELASDAGIYVVNVPCSDFVVPNRRKVEQVLKLIEKLEGPVYIHCKHGKDRTGYMCAAYRMKVQGWSYDFAVGEMFQLGFHKMPYIWWVWFLKKYEGEYKPETFESASASGVYTVKTRVYFSKSRENCSSDDIFKIPYPYYHMPEPTYVEHSSSSSNCESSNSGSSWSDSSSSCDSSSSDFGGSSDL